MNQKIILFLNRRAIDEDYVGLSNNLRHPKLKEIVTCRRKLLKEKAKREFVKQLAERSVLKRHVPKKALKLLKRFPELGKDIENFVRDNRIGADAWRRTGVATEVCRRARKGFNVRLNVDSHWSVAFYKGLDRIQLEDARDKTIVNRDA